jgi:hypothetical protein
LGVFGFFTIGRLARRVFFSAAAFAAPLTVPSGFTYRVSGVVTPGVLSGVDALATWELAGRDSRGACPKRIFSFLPGFSTPWLLLLAA